MPVFKRRTRTVNFRLSEEEFESLRKACLAEGARSLSDFARSVVCRSLGGASEAFSLREGMRRIDLRLDMLHREVKELTEMIGGSNAVTSIEAEPITKAAGGE